jgi:hypothetical protein
MAAVLKLKPVWLVPVDHRLTKVIVRSYELKDGSFEHFFPYPALRAGVCKATVLRNHYPLIGDCTCHEFTYYESCQHIELANEAERIINEAKWQEHQAMRGPDNDPEWFSRLRQACGEKGEVE